MPDFSLADFVTYVRTHLTGDEKGESADFLDHLFRALGHDGIKEAGATRETRLAKKGGAKGKNFADLMWPERVLIEMKSRGRKLERHYDQLFDPVEKIALADLPARAEALAFLLQRAIDLPQPSSRGSA
ncbi:hypothetical protein HZ994_07990 [Akkermansiaceae bacterium]|nr:hypothetical protein HZ994_07990 [Akkermansiaceae bacterium]